MGIKSKDDLRRYSIEELEKMCPKDKRLFVRLNAVGRRGGELIAALVELMAGVTLNPDELNLVLAFGGE